MLTALHVLAALLASFRLVDMLLLDRIAEPIRKRLSKYYLFSCPKCLSVWGGAACTAALALFPWLNWPLAVSWLYIATLEAKKYLYSPEVKYVPYIPRREMGQRIQDLLGDQLIAHAKLQVQNEELRDQLQRVTT